jgi:hypothetical protein
MVRPAPGLINLRASLSPATKAERLLIADLRHSVAFWAATSLLGWIVAGIATLAALIEAVLLVTRHG